MAADRVKSEGDVERDHEQVTTRISGESPNDTYVGRDQGQDEGYAGETGAERRGDRSRNANRS